MLLECLRAGHQIQARPVVEECRLISSTLHLHLPHILHRVQITCQEHRQVLHIRLQVHLTRPQAQFILQRVLTTRQRHQITIRHRQAILHRILIHHQVQVIALRARNIKQQVPIILLHILQPVLIHRQVHHTAQRRLFILQLLRVIHRAHQTILGVHHHFRQRHQAIHLAVQIIRQLRRATVHRALNIRLIIRPAHQVIRPAQRNILHRVHHTVQLHHRTVPRLNTRRQVLRAIIHLFHRAIQALRLLDILQLIALAALNIHRQVRFTVQHRLSIRKIQIKIRVHHIQAQRQAVPKRSNINSNKINMASAGKHLDL